MTPGVVVTIAAVGGWLILYACVLVATRSGASPPGPPDLTLPDEAPAVANLLVNRGRLTPEAADATLLDLAARGHVELRESAEDPRRVVVHVVEPTGDDPAPELARFERRVLDRLRRQPDPARRRSLREHARAVAWWAEFRNDVARAARAAGLTRPRLSLAGRMALLIAVALVSTVAVRAIDNRAYTAIHRDLDGLVGLAILLVLAVVASIPVGERVTTTGRAAASRWLGVRAAMAADETFATTTPAAAALWGRYLGYGATLGVARVATAVVNLGLADHRRLWSSYGGWHPVRVRYPRTWHAGRTGTALATWAVGVAVVGAATITAGHASHLRWTTPLAYLLWAYAAYVLVRAAVDRRPVAVRGQVLWRQRSADFSLWRPEYLAVDDGHASHTRAWIVPAEAEPALPGDAVALSGHRWTRRMTTISVTRRGTFTLPRQSGPVSPVMLAASRSHTHGEPGAAPDGPPLSADTVSHLLGMPVTLLGNTVLRDVLTTTYANARHQPVLMVMVMRAPLGEQQWLSMGPVRRPLAGIGDEARVTSRRGMARIGNTYLTVSLLNSARASGQGALPGLLAQAVHGLPPPFSQPAEVNG